MKRDGHYRQVSAREQERRWIKEAKRFRLARIKTAKDAARFYIDFGTAPPSSVLNGNESKGSPKC
jgi:hypothetical protein